MADGNGVTRPSSSQVQFDVNSFLKKTLSNFELNQQPDNAPVSFPQTHSKPRRRSRSREASPRIKNKMTDATSVPLLAPASAQTALLIPDEGQIRPQNVKNMTPSASRASLASAASSKPVCRICHIPAEMPSDPLISPCRCSGTMKFVHTACLVHWLEISTKKMCPSPQCELCGYFYKTHNCLTFQRFHVPHCDPRDRILHFVFILVFIIMIGCAALSILYLRADPHGRLRSTLNTDDVIVIVCSVLFFCSFFIAVFTQYRAEASLCRMFFRCWLINRNWRIRNYDKKDDPELWPPAAMYVENGQQKDQPITIE